MRRWLYSRWMRLRGYRRFYLTGRREVGGWKRPTAYDPRVPFKTAEGITDDGRHIIFYGHASPQERRDK